MPTSFSPGDVIKVRHPLWHADLVVGPTPQRLRHSVHHSTATYDAAGDLLWVNWDHYNAELFQRRDDAYYGIDLGRQGSGVPLDRRRYALCADAMVEIDMVSLKVPHGRGSVYVRPGTSDVPRFEAIFFAGDYDVPVLTKTCRNIVDLGASTGLSSIYLAEQCPDARVIAVEPAHDNFLVLAANVQNRPSIAPVEAAVWSENRLMNIRDHGPAGDMMLAQADRTVDQGNGLGSYSVEAVDMPTLMQRYGLGFIDVLNIDIEGAEYDLLSGSDLAWLEQVRSIVIATHERFRLGVDELVSHILRTRFQELPAHGKNRIFTQRTGD